MRGLAGEHGERVMIVTMVTMAKDDPDHQPRTGAQRRR
jgi:hypothetical protein